MINMSAAGPPLFRLATYWCMALAGSVLAIWYAPDLAAPKVQVVVEEPGHLVGTTGRRVRSLSWSCTVLEKGDPPQVSEIRVLSVCQRGDVLTVRRTSRGLKSTDEVVAMSLLGGIVLGASVILLRRDNSNDSRRGRHAAH
jgi:hypothetical protein